MDGLIGNTPMIELSYRYQGEERKLYIKLEYYNLTGSIKDRIADYIIRFAHQRGTLKPGMPIVEATSGNTGIAFSALGSYYHHPVTIFMPNWVSRERVLLMESYGANVTLVSKEDGGFGKCIALAEEYVKQKNAFCPHQFSNTDNWMAHYETTGREMIHQLRGITLGGFICGIGTGGTLMGTTRRLKEAYPSLVVGALEPDSMPLLSKLEIKGSHKIEGIGDDFIPELVDQGKIDKVYLVNDQDAIDMARKLARQLGLGVGISSGANLLGAILLQEELGKPVATVFPDDNKKYLTTDLTKPLEENPAFLSNQIELISYNIIKSW